MILKRWLFVGRNILLTVNQITVFIWICYIFLHFLTQIRKSHNVFITFMNAFSLLPEIILNLFEFFKSLLISFIYLIDDWFFYLGYWYIYDVITMIALLCWMFSIIFHVIRSWHWCLRVYFLMVIISKLLVRNVLALSKVYVHVVIVEIITSIVKIVKSFSGILRICTGANIVIFVQQIKLFALLFWIIVLKIIKIHQTFYSEVFLFRFKIWLLFHQIPLNLPWKLQIFKRQSFILNFEVENIRVKLFNKRLIFLDLFLRLRKKGFKVIDSFLKAETLLAWNRVDFFVE